MEDRFNCLILNKKKKYCRLKFLPPLPPNVDDIFGGYKNCSLIKLVINLHIHAQITTLYIDSFIFFYYIQNFFYILQTII